MILSDHSIKKALKNGRVALSPLGEWAVQPSSIDVRLGSEFIVFDNHTWTTIVPTKYQAGITREVTCNPDGSFILHPGEFVLGATIERLRLPNDLVARLEGKSSLGRLGLQVHSTAGFIDAGWDGRLTLELSNVATLPIVLYAGMNIAQVSLFEMSTPADQPYGSDDLRSKYQGQSGPSASLYWRDYLDGEGQV